MVQTESSIQASTAEDDAGAPDPATYENWSVGILDAMDSLLEKAEANLDNKADAELVH